MISHVGRRAVAAEKAAAASNLPMVGFGHIKTAVAMQFERMSAHPLFCTAVDKDALWDRYLASFPPGTDPLFRKRTEHDCSCCRAFIRTAGALVALIDGKPESIWDFHTDHPAYQAVGDTMAAFVKAAPIENVFFHYEATIGTDRNRSMTDNILETWEHFFVRLPRHNERSLICAKVEIGRRLSEARALHDVLLRSLIEITPDAINTILELISRNSLYRGEEHQHAVAKFHDLKAAFDGLPPADRDGFAWLRSVDVPGAVSKIRNTSIGTLLIDLSEGRDLEEAVGAFERMVAPQNYRRPTALVTKAMVDRAKATVDSLGLTSALGRRYARLSDVAVRNVLFADRSARKVMEGGVWDGIAATTTAKPRSLDKFEDVGMERFLADIIPHTESIELLVENRHAGNFVSLIAPEDPGATLLFKWSNSFSWSYAGDVADSIRERVKRAGGNVSGDICCRLAWFNRDDLDFHMNEPDGNQIFYANKGPSRNSRGQLDVDMNVRGETTEPVENIFYRDERQMQEGTYRLFVHSYTKRETEDVGFEAEIDIKGTVHRFIYPKALRYNETVAVATLRRSRAKGVEIVDSLPSAVASRKVWNLDTETFNRVSVIMLSPNHWHGSGVGNRHWFFMLDGCRNDGTARGFYNEFLRGDLEAHRKVLELVGARMRAGESLDQLSGLGFSSTRRDHVVARVKGTINRVVKIVF